MLLCVAFHRWQRLSLTFNLQTMKLKVLLLCFLAFFYAVMHYRLAPTFRPFPRHSHVPFICPFISLSHILVHIRGSDTLVMLFHICMQKYTILAYLHIGIYYGPFISDQPSVCLSVRAFASSTIEAISKNLDSDSLSRQRLRNKRTRLKNEDDIED